MMPLERTPNRASVTPARIQMDCEVPNLNDTETGFNLSDAEQFRSGESSQIYSNEFRLIKLPTFWQKHPKL